MGIIQTCLMLVISDIKYEKKIHQIFYQHQVRLQWCFYGKGSATSEMMDVLGLDERQRVLILGMIPQSKSTDLFYEFENKLHFKKKATGIVMIFPLMSDTIERKEKMNHNYSMILIALDHGYCHEVINTAKKEGARGGTLLKASKSEDNITFMGMQLQKEQDIICIIVPHKIQAQVMKSLSEQYGEKSEAHGILVALPIEDILGLEEN